MGWALWGDLEAVQASLGEAEGDASGRFRERPLPAGEALAGAPPPFRNKLPLLLLLAGGESLGAPPGTARPRRVSCSESRAL